MTDAPELGHFNFVLVLSLLFHKVQEMFQEARLVLALNAGLIPDRSEDWVLGLMLFKSILLKSLRVFEFVEKQVDKIVKRRVWGGFFEHFCFVAW